MLEKLMEQKWMMGVSIALLVLSILQQIIIGFLYQTMIQETDNMSATTNKLLKQCKLKFVNCYRLNSGVPNIPVFVDKFINRLTLGKISFRTIYHMSGQLMLLSVFFAGLGACVNIAGGASLGQVLPFYIVSLLGLYLYFSVSSIVDIKGKRGILKINLVDYLENHMVNRLHTTGTEETPAKGYAGKTMPDMEEELLPPPKTAKELLSSMEEDELEELLRELLA